MKTLSATSMIFLLLSSIFIYSQLSAQDTNQLTQAEFIDVCIRILGLENQISISAFYVSSLETKTLQEKITLLESMGIEPLNGWVPDKPLTRGDIASTLTNIMGISVTKNSSEAHIRALTDMDIISTTTKKTKIDDALSMIDLADFITTTSASGLSISSPATNPAAGITANTTNSTPGASAFTNPFRNTASTPTEIAAAPPGPPGPFMPPPVSPTTW